MARGFRVCLPTVEGIIHSLRGAASDKLHHYLIQITHTHRARQGAHHANTPYILNKHSERSFNRFSIRADLFRRRLIHTHTQNTHKLMKNHTTQQGNHYYIDGVFAFITFGAPKLTFWEDAEELETWVDAQY